MMGVETGQSHDDLQRRIGYDFRDPGFLREALTHSSFANEKPGGGAEHNERLEFLGDAVLGLAAAGYLCELFPDVREGELSRLRARLVNEKSLAEAARRLALGEHLLLGRGEERSGGRQKQSILADAAEALVGAVFRDGGWSEAYRVVRSFFLQTPEGGVLRAPPDAKTRLQELCQERFREAPHYRLLSQSGPSHEPIFTVAVVRGDEALAEGTGKSKKEAEQAAAEEALGKLDRP
jgi:ribonuclease-3